MRRHFIQQWLKQNIPDSKVHGANMGPIWGQPDPGGPHVGPMNFAIWKSEFELTKETPYLTLLMSYGVCIIRIWEDMMMSPNGDIFRVTGPLRAGTSKFPSQRPVTRSFDVLFDLCLNKRLSKHPRCLWFEMSCSLWHHCNERLVKSAFN